MKFKQFLKILTEDQLSSVRMKPVTLTYHARRLFNTWKAVLPFIHPGSRILSFGASGSGVEKVLQLTARKVTVVDFLDQLAKDEVYNRFLGYRAIAAEYFSSGYPLNADVILYNEVIEHIPKSPRRQITEIKRHLKDDGIIVITTPNQASILTILNLLFMRPILENAERTFSEVSHNDSSVHRREYQKAELVEALELNGFEVAYHRYIFNSYKPAWR